MILAQGILSLKTDNKILSVVINPFDNGTRLRERVGPGSMERAKLKPNHRPLLMSQAHLVSNQDYVVFNKSL